MCHDNNNNLQNGLATELKSTAQLCTHLTMIRNQLQPPKPPKLYLNQHDSTTSNHTTMSPNYYIQIIIHHFITYHCHHPSEPSGPPPMPQHPSLLSLPHHRPISHQMPPPSPTTNPPPPVNL